MEQTAPPSRSCPKCGSGDYTFRSRKQIEATGAQGPMVQVKYLCRQCEKSWTETVSGVLRKTPRPE